MRGMWSLFGLPRLGLIKLAAGGRSRGKVLNMEPINIEVRYLLTCDHAQVKPDLEHSSHEKNECVLVCVVMQCIPRKCLGLLECNYGKSGVVKPRSDLLLLSFSFKNCVRNLIGPESYAPEPQSPCAFLRASKVLHLEPGASYRRGQSGPSYFE